MSILGGYRTWQRGVGCCTRAYIPSRNNAGTDRHALTRRRCAEEQCHRQGDCRGSSRTHRSLVHHQRSARAGPPPGMHYENRPRCDSITTWATAFVQRTFVQLILAVKRFFKQRLLSVVPLARSAWGFRIGLCILCLYFSHLCNARK